MIVAAIWKDLQLLVRDRGTLISLFALPIVFMGVFGVMFRFGPDAGRARPVAVYQDKVGKLGTNITIALNAGFTAVPAVSAEDARAKVAAGEVDAALIIGPQPPVELCMDPSMPLQVRAPIEGALTGIVQAVVAGPHPPAVTVTSPPGIEAPVRQKISSFQVTVPGNAVLFGFYIALTVAMSFAGERKTGAWRRLLAAPVPRYKVMLATLVPYYVIGCLQLAFLFGIGAVAFGMEVAGSVAALVALSAAVVACAVSLGLLFASVGGSERQLGGIGSVVLLVMGLLGGCMMPRIVMPPFMQSLGHVVPHSWALDGYYDILVRANTGVADVLPAIGALMAFAAGFATLGLARFRFER